MSEAGKRMIQSARQALAWAKIHRDQLARPGLRPARPTYTEQLRALEENWYEPNPEFLAFLWRKK